MGKVVYSEYSMVLTIFYSMNKNNLFQFLTNLKYMIQQILICTMVITGIWICWCHARLRGSPRRDLMCSCMNVSISNVKSNGVSLGIIWNSSRISYVIIIATRNAFALSPWSIWPYSFSMATRTPTTKDYSQQSNDKLHNFCANMLTYCQVVDKGEVNKQSLFYLFWHNYFLSPFP